MNNRYHATGRTATRWRRVPFAGFGTHRTLEELLLLLLSGAEGTRGRKSFVAIPSPGNGYDCKVYYEMTNFKIWKYKHRRPLWHWNYFRLKMCLQTLCKKYLCKYHLNIFSSTRSFLHLFLNADLPVCLSVRSLVSISAVSIVGFPKKNVERRIGWWFKMDRWTFSFLIFQKKIKGKLWI